MKKVVFVVAAVVVLAMAGMLVVGRFVMSSAGPYSVTSSAVYAASPELVAYQEALREGELGLGDFQELMTSPDDTVGQLAALELFGDREEGAVMFFDKLPEVSSGVKDRLRSSTYLDWQFKLAGKEVAGPDGATRDGAALFLRLPYTRDRLDEATVSGIGDSLVEAIPGADGAFANDLAWTIGLYPPSSLDGLNKHLRSGDAEVRLVAVQALGRLGDGQSLDRVRRRKKDSDVTVREAAYVAEASIIDSVREKAVLAIATPGTVQRLVDSESERKNAKKRLGMP